MIKTLFVSVILLCVFTTTSEAEILLNADKTGQLHGDLQAASLAEVRSLLEQKYGIRFKGDESLFQTDVTVSFENLSLAKAIKRIFSKMNVVFKYDIHGKITEVDLLPANEKGTNPIAATNYMKNQGPQTVVEPMPAPVQSNDAVPGEAQQTGPEDSNNQPVEENQGVDDQNSTDQNTENMSSPQVGPDSPSEDNAPQN